MAFRSWHPIKTQFCEHAGCEVDLEVQVVYPAEILPDQAPRVLSHRCSEGLICNLIDKPSCVWAGTNPAFDPFAQT